jgi:hypothetical protein
LAYFFFCPVEHRTPSPGTPLVATAKRLGKANNGTADSGYRAIND